MSLLWTQQALGSDGVYGVENQTENSKKVILEGGTDFVSELCTKEAWAGVDF